MTIDPANPNIMHESYFTSLEPHHFRFVEQDGEARLNLQPGIDPTQTTLF
jgi:hypothetical protein